MNSISSCTGFPCASDCRVCAFRILSNCKYLMYDRPPVSVSMLVPLCSGSSSASLALPSPLMVSAAGAAAAPFVAAEASAVPFPLVCPVRVSSWRAALRLAVEGRSELGEGKRKKSF